MRLIQFTTDTDPSSRVGLLKDDEVVDCTHEGLPGSLIDLLHVPNHLEKLETILEKSSRTLDLTSVKLLAPVTKPDKVICVGLNYKEHCDELNIPYPTEPIFFSKFSSTIVGPFDSVGKPACTEALDWEVELVVVMGKKCYLIEKDHAFDYVLGYTVGQDITARDWVTPDKNGGQVLLGKSMDSFCPLGPCIVTKDEIADPHSLRLKTWVNGVLKQDGSTSEMIHGIDDLVAHLSGFMTLYPGDVIMTGTPSGVGHFREPKECLEAGDVVESEIESIGRIANRVLLN